MYTNGSVIMICDRQIDMVMAKQQIAEVGQLGIIVIYYNAT